MMRATIPPERPPEPPSVGGESGEMTRDMIMIGATDSTMTLVVGVERKLVAPVALVGSATWMRAAAASVGIETVNVRRALAAATASCTANSLTPTRSANVSRKASRTEGVKEVTS